MTDQQPPKWRMTAKLWLLLGGLALAVLGWVFAKRSRAISALLLGGAVALFIWSASIAEWCQPADRQFGGFKWGEQVFHEHPTLLTCVRRVYGGE